jgi:hypothetical protein
MHCVTPSPLYPARSMNNVGIAVATPPRYPCTRVMDVAGLGSVDRCAVSVREQQAAPLQAIMGSVPATGVGRAGSRNDRLRYAGKRLLVCIPSVSGGVNGNQDKQED